MKGWCSRAGRYRVPVALSTSAALGGEDLVQAGLGLLLGGQHPIREGLSGEKGQSEKASKISLNA